MLSLYFNCKITGQKLLPDKIDSLLFYPIPYPQKCSAETLTQYQVLLKTLESYTGLIFDVAIFNIEIESSDNSIEEEIKKCINGKFKANKIILRFKRPSTLIEWKKDVMVASSLIEKNSPVLVVMNHDHPFRDYTHQVFYGVLDKVFPEEEENFHKVFIYSHAPESISQILNSDSSFKYINQDKGGIYKRKLGNNSVVSIWILTINTLNYILSKAIGKEGAYMGRIDWEGVTYDNLSLCTYLFPREFFKHFDGYGHVTGIRLISDIRNDKNVLLEYPYRNDVNALVEFYYKRWLDCFLLTVRDAIGKETSFYKPAGTLFRKTIKESLELFRLGYLEPDVAVGLLAEKELINIERGLINHIYYTGNQLFEEIQIDLRIRYGDLFKFKNLIMKYSPSFVFKILLKIKR
jgi:hypothetical protein